MQDGHFTLHVNGERVIERNDILYRDNLADNGSDHWQDAPSPSPGKGHTSTEPIKPTHTSGSGDDGLDGLLGKILEGVDQGLEHIDCQFGFSLNIPNPVPTTSQSDFHHISLIEPLHMSNNPLLVPIATAASVVDNRSLTKQVGFNGIFFRSVFFLCPSPPKSRIYRMKTFFFFFSTFFGGHDEKYATPRDQYIWFKDFALAYNS